MIGPQRGNPSTYAHVNTSHSPLPHGAQGFDLGGPAIHFGKRKLVLLPHPEDPYKEHHTIHFGGKSGTIDFHRTWQDSDGDRKRHETIWAIRQDDIPKALVDVGPQLVQAAQGLYRPLRIGWLRHQRIIPVRGIFPSDMELEALTKESKRRRKWIELDEVKWRELLGLVNPPEGILELADGAYRLLRVRRNGSRWIGAALKLTDVWGTVRLVWVKEADLNPVLRRIWKILLEAGQRYAIRPEDYSKYPPLVGP